MKQNRDRVEIVSDVLSVNNHIVKQIKPPSSDPIKHKVTRPPPAIPKQLPVQQQQPSNQQTSSLIDIRNDADASPKQPDPIQWMIPLPELITNRNIPPLGTHNLTSFYINANRAIDIRMYYRQN
ncbi:unnamed protein product [Didymodactylos carnosus]|uniref:Uncharacterized protein n=1 Tax=Didymodactylos carnosus TaxID=1234261 RepID=A0A8S2X8A8_9BILA|nr:unnamed protein product [Didymodactylos carnosus]CAF4481353.1 unnamed protein product [Didymodactylos carnosus]